eukprot:3002662-Amphidinium_carterae.1
MDPVYAESLFTYLGCSGDQPVRTVGFMAADWYNSLLAQWRVPPADNEPPPAVYSQGGLLGRTARFLCGMEVSVQAAPSVVGDSAVLVQLQNQ